MGDRKRVNISIDAHTYEKLQNLKREYGFGNLCELVVALVHILLDRTEGICRKEYDLPDDDARYIDDMFNELGHVERQPDGTVPVRRHRKELK